MGARQRRRELVSGAVPVVETGVPSECVSVSAVAVDGEVRYSAIPSLGGGGEGIHSQCLSTFTM
jgi:hypothetical protein